MQEEEKIYRVIREVRGLVPRFSNIVTLGRAYPGHKVLVTNDLGEALDRIDAIKEREQHDDLGPFLKIRGRIVPNKRTYVRH